jgi:hypothetical protein
MVSWSGTAVGFALARLEAESPVGCLTSRLALCRVAGGFCGVTGTPVHVENRLLVSGRLREKVRRVRIPLLQLFFKPTILSLRLLLEAEAARVALRVSSSARGYFVIIRGKALDKIHDEAKEESGNVDDGAIHRKRAGRLG